METEAEASKGPEEWLHADDLPSPRPAAPHGASRERPAPPGEESPGGQPAPRGCGLLPGCPSGGMRGILMEERRGLQHTGLGGQSSHPRSRLAGQPAALPLGRAGTVTQSDQGTQRVTGQPDPGSPIRALLASEPRLLTPAPHQAGERRLRPAHC